MRRTPVLLSAAAVAVLLPLAGCSAPNGSANYVDGGTFTVAIAEDIGGQMNVYGSFAGFNGLSPYAYDTLVNVTADGDIVSGLAEEWSADADSAAFTLKEGITCSDGTPLTASTVAAAIEYVNDSANGSVMFGLRVPTVPLTATADDAARTISVELEQPFSFILNTVGLLPIVCQSALDDFDSIADATAGTGPYVLTDAVAGQTYTFTVRDDYTWGPDGATTAEQGIPETIVLRVIKDDTTRANLLLSGEINYAPVAGQDRSRLDAQSLASNDVSSANAWLTFNEVEGRATSDPDVRLAIAQALDLKQVLTIVSEGANTPATGLTPGELAACQGDTVSGTQPAYDIDAAQALLDDAGWVAGADGIRERDGQKLQLDLRYQGSETSHGPAAEYIAEELAKVGVGITLVEDTYDDLIQWWFSTNDYDLSIGAMGLGLPSDGVPYLTGEAAPNGTNVFGIQNEEFAQLAAEASVLPAEEACDVYHEAEKSLWNNVDIVPIANKVVKYYIAGAEVAGVQWGTVGPIPTSIRVVG